MFLRLSWRQSGSNNPQCSPQQQTQINSQGDIQCTLGCTGIVSDTRLYCTDFNLIEDWVTGTRTFLHNPNSIDFGAR